MWNDRYDDHWSMMSGTAGWLMLLVMVVLVVAVGAAVVLLLRDPHRSSSVGPSATGPSPSPSPQELAAGILQERLARGEIDEPEYESRLRTLRG